MFDIGDVIVYGFEGVFTVGEYTASPIDKADTRVFYRLIPTFGLSGNIIIAPSEGGITNMRKVVNKAEAQAIVDKIPSIEPITVEKERNRRDIYKSVMGKGNCEDYVSILKTVKQRRIDFLAQKRRIAETDADFEGMAKRCLFSELSIALGLPYDQVEKLVYDKL